MKFVPLSRSILLDLKQSGYQILTSKNAVDDPDPTWYPLAVADVDEYLLNLDCVGSIDPMKELAILVIEDALNSIDQELLIGQVFIEYNYLQGLQDKIEVYDKRYHFITHPDKYHFAFDPQRVLMRNHALHSGDHFPYLTYLGLHYPEHIIDEIADLEELTRTLICLDAAHARDWFIAHDVAVMESDIWINDEDAILKIKTHQHNDPNWHKRSNDLL